MRYKTEVLVDRTVKDSFYFDNLSHPKQGARKTVSSIKNKYPYALILVMNEKGEVWSFMLVNRMNRKEIKQVSINSIVLTEVDVHMVFSGNRNICEVIK